MIAVIDTIFKPLLNWLNSIYSSIMSLKVPLAHPVNVGQYLGVFGHLGPYWITFITTVAFLAFVYVVILIILGSQGLVIKFRNTVKWW